MISNHKIEQLAILFKDITERKGCVSIPTGYDIIIVAEAKQIALALTELLVIREKIVSLESELSGIDDYLRYAADMAGNDK